MLKYNFFIKLVAVYSIKHYLYIIIITQKLETMTNLQKSDQEYIDFINTKRWDTATKRAAIKQIKKGDKELMTVLNWKMN